MSSSPSDEAKIAISLLEQVSECLKSQDVDKARYLVNELTARRVSVPNFDAILSTLQILIDSARTIDDTNADPVAIVNVINCAQAIARGDILGSSAAAHPDLQNVPNPSLEIHTLTNASIVGPAGAIFTESGKLLTESVVGVDIEKALTGLDNLNITAVHHIEGSVAPMHGFWAEGFWHWMLEWLPKALVLERSGRRPTYIVPPGRQFVVDSLQMLGIDSARIAQQAHIAYTADEILVTTPVVGGAFELYPVVALELRKALLENSRPSDRDSRHVYLRRGNANRPRRVVNEPALEGYLKKYDFRSVDMETLPLSEQIGMMKNADILVGPHGAGMIHSLFMPPNSTVIELFAPTYINPCILSIIRLMNHRYFMIPSALWSGTYQFGDNIDAFCPIVSATVERALNADPFAELRGKYPTPNL